MSLGQAHHLNKFKLSTTFTSETTQVFSLRHLFLEHFTVILDIKRRRRKIKTKKEAEMKENDRQARRRKVKIKKRIGKENQKVIKM